jgi:hypothetical protein
VTTNPRLTVPVPVEWRNELPLTTEERLRVALVRLAGCVCELPLLGYTGGKLIDGPRCRLCNCGIIFEEV